jgi:hypothetical protein
VSHPVLNGTGIEASPKHTRSVGVSERLEVEPVSIVDLCAGSDCFAFIEHVLVMIARRRRKYEFASDVVWVSFQAVEQGLWHRHFPALPSFLIEAEVRRIDQRTHNVQIRRNRMLSDFIKEQLAESDDVVGRRGFAGNVVFHVPKPHVIQEGKRRAFPNRALRETVISAEVNRAGEDAFKPIDVPTIVLPITWPPNSSSISEPE